MYYDFPHERGGERGREGKGGEGVGRGGEDSVCTWLICDFNNLWGFEANIHISCMGLAMEEACRYSTGEYS